MSNDAEKFLTILTISAHRCLTNITGKEVKMLFESLRLLFPKGSCEFDYLKSLTIHGILILCFWTRVLVISEYLELNQNSSNFS